MAGLCEGGNELSGSLKAMLPTNGAMRCRDIQERDLKPHKLLRSLTALMAQFEELWLMKSSNPGEILAMTEFYL
ncbi:hypothetical protein ANN_12688 [Periplaneta americana]|uniref:Uncharacterized protein n=1 Tax=Periplaneta americana TaxID=6978 RepID=A0ABQ8TJ64_PERAM|nr:hypothetical protein ANN_12688 [Periplaneta americana]